MTQEEQILLILKERPITPLEALQECGCFRLASVVHKLRNKGHIIRTDDVKSPTTGNSFARYTLIGNISDDKSNRGSATHQKTESGYKGHAV